MGIDNFRTFAAAFGWHIPSPPFEYPFVRFGEVIMLQGSGSPVPDALFFHTS